MYKNLLIIVMLFVSYSVAVETTFAANTYMISVQDKSTYSIPGNTNQSISGPLLTISPSHDILFCYSGDVEQLKMYQAMVLTAMVQGKGITIEYEPNAKMGFLNGDGSIGAISSYHSQYLRGEAYKIQRIKLY